MSAQRARRDAAQILAGLDANAVIEAHHCQPSAAPSWDAPVPLSARRLLPPFPVDALPSWVADMVGAVAEFTQTPPDLPGCIALAVLSAAAGGRAVVEVRPGWREPTNLFVVVAMAPGSRKSAVFAVLIAPLLGAELDLVEATRPVVIEAELARKVAAKAAERAAATAANTAAANRIDALAEATAETMAAEAITVPVLPRLIADDVTPEAAASLLAEQGGRLAVLSAEGGIFATLAGRYSSGSPNIEVFLKGHAGDLLRVDRKGRPAEHVAAPALTLGLAVQPEILTDLAAVPGFRGRGLLARILYSLPVNTVGHRRIDPDPVPAPLADAYSANVGTLVRALAAWTDPAVLVLSPAAASAVLDHARAIEPRLAPESGDLGHLADWGSKHTGATVRIAGLLHLAAHLHDGWTRPIAADTIAAAARLGHYFLAHALATFDLMGADPVTEDARAALDWIQRTGTYEFTRRDLFTAVKNARFRKVTDLDPALELLEMHGHIARQPAPDPGPKGGRPPSPPYVVNPAVHSAQPAEPAQPQSRRGSAGSAGSAEPPRNPENSR